MCVQLEKEQTVRKERLHLEDALGESLHGLVPVAGRALGQRAEDVRQEDAGLGL